MHFETPVAAPADPKAGPWYKELTRYHWFVFAIAAGGWLADCMDQQLFNLARDPAIAELRNTRVDHEFYGGLATMIFMFGWATGGIIFGIMGDRWGRAKTMLLTILLYSLFTGLSALSVGFYDFTFYRFLTGLGVGGEFAVGVALLAEVMPDRARPHALGWLQATSTIGNVSAALIGLVLAWLEQSDSLKGWKPWRYEFIVGAAPALLVVFFGRRLKEPERWKAMHANLKPGQKIGSMVELLTVPGLRHNALVGLVLATSGVVGLWAIGFFGFGLTRNVFRQPFRDEARTPQAVAEARTLVGIAMANPATLAEVNAKIQPAWLLDEPSQEVFSAQVKLSQDGEALTPAALEKALGANNKKQEFSEAQLREKFLVPADSNTVPLSELLDRITQRNREVDSRLTWWTSIYGLMFNLGAFFGIYSFSRFTNVVGRKPAFAGAFILALISTALTFWNLNRLSDIFWMVPLMGFCQLSLFCGYAIYFPELFPTRLRSTGTSFCYNVGRYLAAPGPLLLGTLATGVYGFRGEVESLRYAGVTMCAFLPVGPGGVAFCPGNRG